MGIRDVSKMSTSELIEWLEGFLSWDDGIECAVPDEFYELAKRFGYEKKFVKAQNQEEIK